MIRLETPLAFSSNFFANTDGYSAVVEAITIPKVSTNLQASIYEKRNRQGEVVMEMVLLKSKLAARQGCLPQTFVISTFKQCQDPSFKGPSHLEADSKVHIS